VGTWVFDYLQLGVKRTLTVQYGIGYCASPGAIQTTAIGC